MTHLQFSDPRPLIFTLLHVVFDIKLRDSTGQVKVHKIKEKKETRRKGKENN